MNRKAARIARLPATPADLVSGNDIHCFAAKSAVERQQLYYLRNRCSHGFVSVDERRKVIVQETGLDSEHPPGIDFLLTLFNIMKKVFFIVNILHML